RAGLLELGLDRVGLVLGDALLDRLRGRVDEVLRLFEAETRDRADDLDHLDLLASRGSEDDVERRLLLLCRRPVSASWRRACRNCDRGCGCDAPLVLDLLLQLDEIEHGHLPELVEHLVDCACSHLLLLLLRLSGGCLFCRCLYRRRHTLWLRATNWFGGVTAQLFDARVEQAV